MTERRRIRQRTASGPTNFRKILQGLLFAGQIHFALRENKNHFRLKILQINLNFADSFHGHGPISLQADSIEGKYDPFPAS
jgi:hypothetical protein